jgi:hypothetical protein
MAGFAQKVFVANTVSEPVQVSGSVTTSSSKSEPENYIYKLLVRVSGPQSATGEDYDLNTDSDVTSSVFEWEVPAGREFSLSRLNFEILDDAIRPTRFGGLGALANGCLFEIADADDSTVTDFTDGVPITINAHFSLLAGVDVPVVDSVGSDLLPIRFTVAKAGAPMILTAGQKVRWTNQDDLSDMTEFRIMVQGIYIT